ncbi:MAG: DUF6470 family protein [Fusobacteriota bacterium]
MINTPILKINTIDAKVNIKKRDAQMNIKGNQADMTLKRKKHRFQVNTKDAKVEIDNYPAFRQFDNSKTTMDMERKVSSESMQKSYKAIAQYSSDGDAMMNIENSSGNVLAKIAADKAFGDLEREIGLQHFPKENIKIRVKKGNVRTNYIPGKIETNVRKNLQISSTPGKIDISANYPKVIIDLKGKNINYKA